MKVTKQYEEKKAKPDKIQFLKEKWRLRMQKKKRKRKKKRDMSSII